MSVYRSVLGEIPKTLLPPRFPKAILILKIFCFIHFLSKSVSNNFLLQHISLFNRISHIISLLSLNISSPHETVANLSALQLKSVPGSIAKTTQLYSNPQLLLTGKKKKRSSESRRINEASLPKEFLTNYLDNFPHPAHPILYFTQCTDITALQHEADLSLWISSKILHHNFKVWPSVFQFLI